MMSNLRRDTSRRKANRKRAVTISLVLSLCAFAAISPAQAKPHQDAAASLVAGDWPQAPIPDGGAEPDPCTDPCFSPPTFSISKAGSIWVVVNKKRPLSPIDYQPKLVVVSFSKKGHNPYSLSMAPEAAKAMALMFTDAEKAGAGTLFLQSAYRSYRYQVSIHARQVKRLGLRAGEALAARAGYSEHQTGLAADVGAVGQGCLIQVCFAHTRAGLFLHRWAYKYGFIVRYPVDQTSITGYQFEPWHMRYVGVALATKMHKQGVTVLENFWSLPPAPKY